MGLGSYVGCMNALLANEPLIRGVALGGVLALMLAAEALWPRRKRALTRMQRWPTNIAFVALGGLVTRLMMFLPAPLAGVTMAVFAERIGFGALNAIAAPVWLEMLAAIVLLDLAIWGQHVAFHRVPQLWALHAVHHADRDFDATTALRFHPVEIAISALYKAVVVALVGAPVAAVLVFDVLLNACATFNHANLKLPRFAERALRLVLVTPDLHRVHHSIHADEHMSNFGFCLSVWDRLFGALREAPRGGHEGMVIGLPAHQSAAPARLLWSLALPWRRSVSPVLESPPTGKR